MSRAASERLRSFGLRCFGVRGFGLRMGCSIWCFDNDDGCNLLAASPIGSTHVKQRRALNHRRSPQKSLRRTLPALLLSRLGKHSAPNVGGPWAKVAVGTFPTVRRGAVRDARKILEFRSAVDHIAQNQHAGTTLSPRRRTSYKAPATRRYPNVLPRIGTGTSMW